MGSVLKPKYDHGTKQNQFMNFKIVLLIFLLRVNLYAQNQYSKGFQAGFPIGYCQEMGLGCLPPLTPMTPMLRIGESLNNYNEGYNRGFTEGLTRSRAKKSSENDKPDSFNRPDQFIPQILYTPDWESIERVYSEKQNQEINRLQIEDDRKQYDNREKLFRERLEFIIAFDSPENVNKRKAEYDAIKFASTNIINYPKKIPDGVYTVSIIFEKIHRVFVIDAIAYTQNNRVIYLNYNNAYFGNLQSAFAKGFFPQEIFNFEDISIIEPIFDIQNGVSKVRIRYFSEYKNSFISEYEVYFNNYLTEFNKVQIILNGLSSQSNSKIAHIKLSNGWHSGYLTDLEAFYEKRNFYIENEKVIKWITSSGEEGKVDSGGIISDGKATFSRIQPALIPKLTQTSFSRPKIILYEAYF